MKNIFTPEEIHCGMFIIKNSASKPLKDLSFARKVTYKIGFCYDDNKKYGLCSVLTDGFYVGLARTIEELCEHLNDDNKGYRPLTKEELIELINSSNQGFY